MVFCFTRVTEYDILYAIVGRILPTGAAIANGGMRMQEDLLSLLRSLAPEQMEEIGRRAQVLTAVENMQPVGRRALAFRLNLPEREVRAIATSLRSQGLLQMDAAGMQLTGKAVAVLPGARELSRTLFGITKLEQDLETLLHIPSVTVVPGDADRDPQVLRNVGRAAAQRVHRLLQNGMTMAVGGGRTMLEVAAGMQPAGSMNVMVVPARGGVGSDVESQANVIAADIAARIGGRYRVIHLPDSLDQEALDEMRRLPEVEEVLGLMQQARLVVHGVGRADEMAMRRGLDSETRKWLSERGAVGEAFGDFFNEQGETVYQMSTVSVGLGRFDTPPGLVAVAAGTGKAEAIIAAARHEGHDSLITDEGAAGRICDLLSGK